MINHYAYNVFDLDPGHFLHRKFTSKAAFEVSQCLLYFAILPHRLHTPVSISGTIRECWPPVPRSQSPILNLPLEQGFSANRGW